MYINSYKHLLLVPSYIWHIGQTFILPNEFLHPALIGLTIHNTRKTINGFFTNIATNLVSKLPAVVSNFSINSKTLKDFYVHKGVNSVGLILQEVTNEFIHMELSSINPHKSTGLDGISPRFIKEGADILSLPICHIVNLSITTCSVPDDIKVAKVTPLHKKNSKLEVGN